jgi:hypothetical protein
MTGLDDIPDLYEHEKKLAEMCVGALQRRYAGEQNMNDEAVRNRFSREAAGACAENGLVAEVIWDWDDPETGDFSPTVSDDPNDHNIYWIPRVRITGRVTKLAEYDHDRQAHEVTHGVADGKPGWVDVNTGKLRDEPRKKNIL